ncbi:MAG: zinc-dependent alcohol dehydrogenase family protein [Christensenellales bacterium]|jgi:threonine dehydrogenase-like Zn-dependent dehydrogenase
MKGCYYLGGGTFAVREREEAVPGPGEIRIEVKACGICGTDVHIAQGEKGSAEVQPPVILGHEFAGIVTAAGPGVTRVRIGEAVAVDPNIYCGNCYYCHNGAKQFCSAMEALGVTRDGGFAQSCLLPETQAFPMDPGLDFREMAMAEPLACCLRGLSRLDIRPGAIACVVGGGAIGQLMAQLLWMRGASRVYLSEPLEKRRSLALQLGASAVFVPSDSLAEALREASGRRGMDIVVECAGNTAAAAAAVEMADRGGQVLFFSVPKPDALLPLPMMQVYQKELRIFGSFINPDTQGQAAALLNSRRLEMKPLFTHSFPLERTAEAVERQTDPSAVKVMVLPNTEEGKDTV